MSFTIALLKPNKYLVTDFDDSLTHENIRDSITDFVDIIEVSSADNMMEKIVEHIKHTPDLLADTCM